MDVDIDEEIFVLIKLCNANTEKEQIKTIYEIRDLKVDRCQSNWYVMLKQS